MSDLVDLLRSQEARIREEFGERIGRADVGDPAQTMGEDCGPMLEAVAAYLAQDDGHEAAVRWARQLSQPAPKAGLSQGRVLAGLSSFAQAVRHQAVVQLDHQAVLLASLQDLDEAVDALRRAYLATRSGEPEISLVRHALALVAEESSDFVCLATRHGKPFYLNRAGRQLVGLEEKSELSSTLHDYHSDASWERLRDEAVPAVNRYGRWEGECQLRHRKTGGLVEVQTTILLVREPATGKPRSLAIVHRPGGKQREEALAEALAESEARKHAILESALDPIVTIDHEGVITEFNRAAESVFGHSRTTVLGTRPSEVLFPPPSMAGQQVRIDRYLEAGEGSMLGKRTEVTAVRASGEAFPAEMAMTLNYEHGKPLMTFFIRDIGDRKRAEEEQARYAADLERSNQELEQFAYVASHDLQEPLRKIRTFGDRLATSCAAALDPTGRECLERMQTAAERMQSLIQGLLTLSRVTTKGQEFVPVDLAAVAAEVVSDLEVQIQQVQGRVELGRLPSIMADPLQIRQLLQNLIGNALKFRREDEPPVVRVHARFVGDREGRPARDALAGEQCRLVVEDNGVGFEEKYAERIFGVFQRLHTREAYPGTGIGLAICKKIAERHGGSIAARSTPGQGAVFTVLLPAVHRKPKS
jgi:two-component system sensor kinase FixL